VQLLGRDPDTEHTDRSPVNPDPVSRTTALPTSRRTGAGRS
jgi:hypothetical protein